MPSGSAPNNTRLRWLLLYILWLFAILPVAPFIWRTWLLPRVDGWLSLDAIHVVEYVVLGFLLGWSRLHWLAARRGRAVLVLLAVAAADELVQGALPNRFADARDFVCDWVGGLAGWYFYALRLRCQQRRQNPLDIG